MAVRITPATVTDIRQVVADHSRYWGERDLRSLHLLALVQEFGETCLVARSADEGDDAPSGGGRDRELAPHLQ